MIKILRFLLERWYSFLAMPKRERREKHRADGMGRWLQGAQRQLPAVVPTGEWGAEMAVRMPQEGNMGRNRYFNILFCWLCMAQLLLL